jgi:hypothetical protein
MSSTVANARPAQLLVGISGLTLALAAVASAQTPKPAPEIKSIESLWFAPMPPFTTTAEGASAQARVKIITEWQQTKVFDAIVLLDLPPTYVDHQDSVMRANALMKEVGGRFIIGTLPVGKEGWESSGNERFAKKAAAGLGTHYDASKAMSQAQWLETRKDLQSDTRAWIMEHPARMPTPDQAARSASEFVQFARSQHKKTVIWLSGQALTHGKQTEELIKRVCEATRDNADFFVWMDLPAESLEAGESRWRESMGQLLDKILKLTPPEKTVIQWLNNPQWPTKDVDGTKEYIKICQAKGINRFSLLANPQFLDREPWRTFYRTIPKAAAPAPK